MAGVNKELQINKQPWLGPELKLILKSLESKLQKKIYSDVSIDFEKAVSDAKKHKGIENGHSDVQSSTSNSECPVKSVMKSCLALIKFLQYEGDIQYMSNEPHSKIIQAIETNFDNKEDTVHHYLRNLTKIIENEKNCGSFKQDTSL